MVEGGVVVGGRWVAGWAKRAVGVRFKVGRGRWVGLLTGHAGGDVCLGWFVTIIVVCGQDGSVG